MKITIRARLIEAFAALRKDGVFARANFLCCGGCASAQMAEFGVAKGHRPYVFWTRQDEGSSGEGVWLGYGHTGNHDDDAAVRAGRKIVEALRRHGLLVEWDGRPTRRILVSGCE